VVKPNRNIGGNVDEMLESGRLSAFRPRAGGTDAERRAAGHLAARLEQLGRRTVIEPTRVRPSSALVHLLHAVLGIAGAADVLVAAVSTLGELTGSFFLARRFTGARASQNVVSADDEGKPGSLILLARYDEGSDALMHRARLRLWPGVFFWSLMVILLCATVRLFGIEPTALTVIQFVPTVILIAMVPLFVDAALARRQGGEPNSAAGAATALRLAERYSGALEHFDLTVVLTGADHAVPLGTRAWLRRERGAFDLEATAVVVVDGSAQPRYATKEGPVFSTRLHPGLVSIGADVEGAEPYISRELSGAHAARAARLPAIRVSTFEVASELLERIDDEIGPRLR
jgi:hypothetical protein